MTSAQDLARLREAFAIPEPDRTETSGAGAVLVPILQRPEGPAVLFTRRAAHLSAHPGQISFPGGGVEPGERPLEAALRETEEEVGIPARHVQVLGHLTDFVTHYGRLVCAYVGLVAPAATAPRVASQEVVGVMVVPVAQLLDPKVYEARFIAEGTADARAGVVHYWHLPEATVWGITGELLARFLERGWGWRPPHEPRPVQDPGRLLPEA